MDIDCRLATYGTLAPGRPNHHELAALEGRWTSGTIRGHLVAKGWGAAMGYPAFVPDEKGQEIDVYLLESSDLPDHWTRLDAFEGAEYRRAAITVMSSNGAIDAWIYLDAQSCNTESSDNSPQS